MFASHVVRTNFTSRVMPTSRHSSYMLSNPISYLSARLRLLSPIHVRSLVRPTRILVLRIYMWLCLPTLRLLLLFRLVFIPISLHCRPNLSNITLKYLTTMKDTSSQMNRWLEKLSRFNFEIRHIPGTTNTAADALSRNLSLYSMDPKVMTASSTTLKRYLRLSLQPVVTGPAPPVDALTTVNIDTDDWFPAYERTSYYKDFIANHVHKARFQMARRPFLARR